MVKILVVDDEAEVRELLKDVFVKKGYSVTTIPTAIQSLDIIFQEPFDLIILDVRLIGESGMSVLKRVRQFHKKIPIVIYSGAVTAELEKEAIAVGANEVLSKSLDIFKLVERIEAIVKAGGQNLEVSPNKEENLILVVDDEHAVRSILRDFFTSKGYKVLEADSGKQALQLARSENISVVLLDMRMPGMDGLATLKKLLDVNPKLGVVMVTAVQDYEEINKALSLGAYGYVLKPFDFLYLELTVTSMIEKASRP